LRPPAKPGSALEEQDCPESSLISAGMSTLGAARLLALWRTSVMGLRSNSSYRHAWLKRTDIKFRILAHVLLALVRLRSHDSNFNRAYLAEFMTSPTRDDPALQQEVIVPSRRVAAPSILLCQFSLLEMPTTILQPSWSVASSVYQQPGPGDQSLDRLTNCFRVRIILHCSDHALSIDSAVHRVRILDHRNCQTAGACLRSHLMMLPRCIKSLRREAVGKWDCSAPFFFSWEILSLCTGGNLSACQI